MRKKPEMNQNCVDEADWKQISQNCGIRQMADGFTNMRLSLKEIIKKRWMLGVWVKQTSNGL